MRRFRLFLRDAIPTPLRKRIIRFFNIVSGNYLNRFLYGKVTYNQDGMATTHNADFMQDARFVAAYTAGRDTGSWTFGDLHWRAYIVCWAAQRCAQLEGDFVECGVNRGGYALSVIHYVDFAKLDKRFFLLDTYEGLVERLISPAEKAAGVRAGEYEPCHEAVVRTFAPYGEKVCIIKGVVPDTLPQVTTGSIAFLSIDMNTREPEIAAAQCCWERMTSGGVIVLDDYGWPKHLEQKLAFDEFARQRGVAVLALPTGQGLIFKP
jgi:O-methyltransferase